MKRIAKFLALMTLLALLPVTINSIMAQPPRPPHKPPPGGAPIGGSAPIQDGTPFLIILASAYLIKKNYPAKAR